MMSIVIRLRTAMFAASKKVGCCPKDLRDQIKCFANSLDLQNISDQREIFVRAMLDLGPSVEKTLTGSRILVGGLLIFAGLDDGYGPDLMTIVGTKDRRRLETWFDLKISQSSPQTGGF